jgi:hypothetical protein
LKHLLRLSRCSSFNFSASNHYFQTWSKQLVLVLH